MGSRGGATRSRKGSARKSESPPHSAAPDPGRDRDICLAWLNDPARESFTDDDLEVYRRIQLAVSETLRLTRPSAKSRPNRTRLRNAASAATIR